MLRAPDGKPDVVIVKRVQATTNVTLFDKGRAEPGTTVWIVGEAWWGLKATVLGPSGTRANTWWGDLSIGERVEADPPANRQSLSEGLDKG